MARESPNRHTHKLTSDKPASRLKIIHKVGSITASAPVLATQNSFAPTTTDTAVDPDSILPLEALAIVQNSASICNKDTTFNFDKKRGRSCEGFEPQNENCTSAEAFLLGHMQLAELLGHCAGGWHNVWRRLGPCCLCNTGKLQRPRAHHTRRRSGTLILLATEQLRGRGPPCIRAGPATQTCRKLGGTKRLQQLAERQLLCASATLRPIQVHSPKAWLCAVGVLGWTFCFRRSSTELLSRTAQCCNPSSSTVSDEELPTRKNNK